MVLEVIKMTLKELKSIDVAHYTTVLTGISVLISIIVSMILIGFFAVAVPGSVGIMIYILPTIIFGTLIWSVFSYFMQSTLYNILSKKIGGVKFDIKGNYIKSISSKETTILASLITIIITVIVYLAVSFILPMILNSMLTVLMYSAQNEAALALYQIMMILNSPLVILAGLLIILIITLCITLLSTYIYNILGNSERGITVELSSEGSYTILDSLEPVNFAVAISAISLIINIISGVIMIINGNDILTTLLSILGGFITSFIACVLVAIFYNYLAPKIGKLKVELI